MGSTASKSCFKRSLTLLTSQERGDVADAAFWRDFWREASASIDGVFADTSGEDVRHLRRHCPSVLATLVLQAVRRLCEASETGCTTQQEQTAVLSCVHVLIRVLPFVLEDGDWRELLWTSPASTDHHQMEPASSQRCVSAQEWRAPPLSDCLTDRRAAVVDDDATENLLTGEASDAATERRAMADTGAAGQALVVAVCDLLFCPDFTVTASSCATAAAAASSSTSGSNSASLPEQHEDIQSIDSCEYIWAAGVGFTASPRQCSSHDQNRTLLLKLLLTCFSEVIYRPASDGVSVSRWLRCFVSTANRHALPLFTSLLNTVCSYDPVGLGVPYNHLLFGDDHHEALVETSLHVLLVCLDESGCRGGERGGGDEGGTCGLTNIVDCVEYDGNLFINYLSRIHRDEDFEFMLKGFTRLLNNPMTQTYLPHSSKKVHFHQELLILLWKCCTYNKRFLYFVLKSGEVLHVVVPVLWHVNAARADPCRVGLVHIGVFILLLLSGERNFGVRLNRPYQGGVTHADLPVFSGTHADLLILTFHRLMIGGHQRIQPLADCLLTILVNVSPYLKTLSMVASTKLVHLLETFSTAWFLFCAPSNHRLVFFLLEIFNNIIQYQFDGNANLVYTIIRKRQVFHALTNLATDAATIDKSSQAKRGRMDSCASNMSNLHTAHQQQPGQQGQTNSQTLNTSLAAMPDIGRMTEHESAHMAITSEAALCAHDQLAEHSTVTRQQNELSADSSVSARVRAMQQQQQQQHQQHQGEGESAEAPWRPTSSWAASWKNRLPLQTIMRLLQVLVPQVEKICIEKGLTDEAEILRFLQHGTLVGLLPVPHPILIRKYQANNSTAHWFRTYMWGVVYLRNTSPPIWFDTDVKLFEIHRG